MPSLNGVPLSCEEILDRYGPLVYRLAIQGTGSVADGEDVAQEVFVSLIRCDPAFDPEYQDEVPYRRYFNDALAHHTPEDLS